MGSFVGMNLPVAGSLGMSVLNLVEVVEVEGFDGDVIEGLGVVTFFLLLGVATLFKIQAVSALVIDDVGLKPPASPTKMPALNNICIEGELVCSGALDISFI